MANHYGFEIKPIPDETFFGLLVAIGILTGCKTYSETYSKLLNKRNICPATLLPKHLLAIREFLPHEYSESEDLLCLKHTALPYFQHFVQPADVLKAKELMLRGGTEIVRNYIRPTGHSISDIRNLKYCPACANEQWSRYDRSTWLISHQLPSVEVCYKHGLALINSGISTSRVGLHFNPIKLPPFTENIQAEQMIWSDGEPWDKTSPNRLIAQISHELLTWKPVSGNKGRVYKASFISAGLGYGEARNWDNIGSLLRSLYGDLIPRRLGITFKCESYRDWIRLITRAKNCIHNPIQHILIIGAMFERLDEFEHALINDTKQHVHFNLSRQPADCLSLVNSKVSDNDQQLLVEKRKTIIKELAAAPHLSRTELKRRITRCYKWLLRNDNEWMQLILPSKAIKTIRGNSVKNRKTIKPPSSIDWASLDQMLSSELYEIPSEQAFGRKSNGELVINRGCKKFCVNGH